MPDTAPLKRLYFDTNILYGWPHPSNNVYPIFGAANWLETELYTPAVVNQELEVQFIRAVTDAYQNLSSNLKQIKRLCRSTIDVKSIHSPSSESELRAAYAVSSEQLRLHFGISIIPLTAAPLSTFIGMAINRSVPFQERIVSNGQAAVVGFQDAAILFSIIDHLKSAPTDGRCAFVSNDGVFQKPEIFALVQAHGVTLEVFRTTNEVFKVSVRLLPSVLPPKSVRSSPEDSCAGGGGGQFDGSKGRASQAAAAKHS